MNMKIYFHTLSLKLLINGSFLLNATCLRKAILLIGLVASLGISELKSQLVMDTLYQTESDIYFMKHSNDYLTWVEGDNKTIIRLHNDIIEVQSVPELYKDCNQQNSLNIYNDFIYYKISDDTEAFCRQGFLWGENELILDTFELGEINAQYNNLFITFGPTIVDIEANSKSLLIIENEEFKYLWGSNFSINDTYVNGKMSKYTLDNTYISAAIIQYNYHTGDFKEILASENWISNYNEYSTTASITITEEHLSGNRDSMKLYLYDGEELHLVAQKYITNSAASSYLDGAVYMSEDSLFFWEDGITILLGTDVNGSFVIENCMLSWSEGFGENSKIVLFNGADYRELVFDGYLESSNILTEGNIFFIAKSLDLSSWYIVSSTHNLNCASECNYPNIQIDSNEERSFLLSKQLDSQAKIENENVIYRATENINLLPGFEVGANQEFMATIIACELSPIQPEAPMTEQQLKIAPTKNVSEEVSLQVTPNPLQQQANIRFYLPENTPIKIYVFDSNGQVLTEQSADGQAGWQTTQLDASRLPAGMYFVSLQTGEGVWMERVVVAR